MASTSKKKPGQSGAESGSNGTKLSTILVPTDFSPESLKALDYALSLLKHFDGTLHLVHVHDVDYAYAATSILATAPLITEGEVESFCRAELQKLASANAAGVSGPTLHCRTGRAFDEISKLAREIKADLLVISTHGHTGLKHFVLGSTTERVVRYSPCPVLVVRERERDFVEPEQDGGQADGPLMVGKIIVPVDFSDCSADGVRYGVAFAKSAGAKLSLVHVLQVQPFLPTEQFAAYNREPSPGVLERAAKMQMRKFVRKIDFDGVPYETSVEIGRPAYQICQVAEKTGADLIVTSTHGSTGLTHVLMGSTAEHVVRYAKCPVLVVPARDRPGVG